MVSRAVVVVASLAWSFGVVSNVLPYLPAKPQGQDVPAGPVSHVDMAVEILRSAKRFSSAGVGYAGLTPNEVMAWRVIFFRPDAESTFLALLDSATPAGQLYALAGLRFGNEATFTQAAARLEGRVDRVQAIRGCIGYEATVSELVAEIRKGVWVRDYLRGSDWPRRS